MIATCNAIDVKMNKNSDALRLFQALCLFLGQFNYLSMYLGPRALELTS